MYRVWGTTNCCGRVIRFWPDTERGRDSFHPLTKGTLKFTVNQRNSALFQVSTFSAELQMLASSNTIWAGKRLTRLSSMTITFLKRMRIFPLSFLGQYYDCQGKQLTQASLVLLFPIQFDRLSKVELL
jgi:hypothetical protein